MDLQPQPLSMEAEELYESYDENCRLAENAALLALNQVDMPILNSMRCLKKSDCWMFLNKYRPLCDAIEQSIALVTLTDFVSCVSVNPDMFPMFVQKHGKQGTDSLLTLLQSHWRRFLSARVTHKDMTVAQMSSVVLLLKDCVRRVDGKASRVFEDILKHSASLLTTMKKPPVSKPNSSPPPGSVQKPNPAASKPVNTEKVSQNQTNKKPLTISDYILKPCENSGAVKSLKNPSRKPLQEEDLNGAEAPKKYLKVECKIVAIDNATHTLKNTSKDNAFKRLMGNGKEDKKCQGGTSPAPKATLNAFDILMNSQKAKVKTLKLNNR